jgi:hypothetical protein
MFNHSGKSMRVEYLVSLYILTSLMIPFAVFNFLNIYSWNISFNPVDFILKPVMIIPVASLLLALLTEWTILAFNYTKRLSVKIKKADGRFSLKLVERSLPIYIIDQNYLNEDFQIKSKTVLDMRI